MFISKSYGKEEHVEAEQYELVKKAVSGNKEAIGKLLEANLKDILYFATKQTNYQEAEEITQNVILLVYKSIGSLKHPEKFHSWLMGVVYHECLRYMKKLRRERNFISHTAIEEMIDIVNDNEEFLPESYLSNEENKRILLNCIDELPERYRNCLVLYYLHGLERSEIAEVLDINIKRVYNDLYRGKEELKKQLEAETDIHFTYSAVPVGAIPVLTKILQADMEQCIATPYAKEIMGRLLSQIESGYFSNYGISSVKGKLNLKLLFCTAVAGVALVAYVSSQGNTENIPEQEMVLEPPVKQEEMEIKTVADMIGQEAAGQLEGYVNNGVDGTSMMKFLENIGAQVDEQGADFDNEYCTYKLEKQNKRLLIATKKTTGGNHMTVLYDFNSRDGYEVKLKNFILEFQP